MIPMGWEDYAIIARLYLDAAVQVSTIRNRSVQAAEVAAASASSTPMQARRMAAQAEMMKEDPLGTYYGRHKGGAFKGEIRTPLEWPSHVSPAEWQPVNDSAENLKLAQAAMQASFDLMRQTS